MRARRLWSVRRPSGRKTLREFYRSRRGQARNGGTSFRTLVARVRGALASRPHSTSEAQPVADSSPLPDCVRRLGGADHDAAWTDFLTEFGPLLLQVAREVERDRDAAGEAFLFACERLAERQCARVRRFDPRGPASFETWLKAVTYNLVIDARRRRQGRFRPLAIIRRLERGGPGAAPPVRARGGGGARGRSNGLSLDDRSSRVLLRPLCDRCGRRHLEWNDR